jgi:hypothetical protein
MNLRMLSALQGPPTQKSRRGFHSRKGDGGGRDREGGERGGERGQRHALDWQGRARTIALGPEAEPAHRYCEALDRDKAGEGAACGENRVKQENATDKSSSSLPASLTKALTLSTLVSVSDLRVAAKILVGEGHRRTDDEEAVSLGRRNGHGSRAGRWTDPRPVRA